ncbi:tyrosine-protein phosphatase [Streptomyces sp. NPDC087845]|uniref:tyrosine-protein phosphatase n=1 Tax=Streptomyces sp. NPDC087845 TaxID=3365806 RepID=UPI00380C6F2E
MPLLNFRDPALTADSHRNRICPATLFRSAQPFPAADQDTVRELRARGIRTIVDLRGDSERSDADWAAAAEAGIRVLWAPLDASAEMEAVDPRSLRTAEDLGRFYLTLAEITPRAIADAVTAAAAPGATLVHCAAGKDRTGLLVALLLDLAGVPLDEIAEDYARTADALPQIFAALAGAADRSALNAGAADRGALNAGAADRGALNAGAADRGALNAGAADRSAPNGGGVARSTAGTALGDRSIPPALLEAPAEAIRTFVDGIRTRHGGTEAFLRGCGADAAVIASFRAKAALVQGPGAAAQKPAPVHAQDPAPVPAAAATVLTADR